MTNITSLFLGMTCSFEELPFEFEICQPWQKHKPTEVRVIPHVVTIDGSMARKEDCSPVYTTGFSTSLSYAGLDYYTEQQLEEAVDSHAVRYCDEADCYAIEKYCKWCEHSDTWEHVSDVEYFDGEYYLKSADLLNVDGHGDTFVLGEDGNDDYHYCGDGNYWPTDECHYCAGSGDYEYGCESECACCTPEDTDRVYNYHRSGISPHVYRKTIADGGSGFAVGFEVEKNSVDGADSEGDHVDATDLFAYWETDASCGIEGVTHAYDPLDAETIAQFKLDVSGASEHLESPCDTRCGGHVNISSEVHTPRELLTAFRVYAPLWYAVYRNRLNCSYVINDKKIEHGREKYSPVITKHFGIEIRLPSRIAGEAQLLRRFAWVGATCQAMQDGLSFNQYVKACRGTLLSGAYANDRTKYANALRLARKFRIWMLDGVVDSSIAQWV